MTLDQELKALRHEVAQLQRTRKRWRLGLVLLGAVALLPAAAGSGSVIRAEHYEIVNSEGEEVAVWTSAGGALLNLSGPNGDASLQVGAGGPSLTLDSEEATKLLLDMKSQGSRSARTFGRGGVLVEFDGPEDFRDEKAIRYVELVCDQDAGYRERSYVADGYASFAGVPTDGCTLYVKSLGTSRFKLGSEQRMIKCSRSEGVLTCR